MQASRVRAAALTARRGFAAGGPRSFGGYSLDAGYLINKGLFVVSAAVGFDIGLRLGEMLLKPAPPAGGETPSNPSSPTQDGACANVIIYK